MRDKPSADSIINPLNPSASQEKAYQEAQYKDLLDKINTLKQQVDAALSALEGLNRNNEDTDKIIKDLTSIRDMLNEDTEDSSDTGKGTGGLMGFLGFGNNASKGTSSPNNKPKAEEFVYEDVYGSPKFPSNPRTRFGVMSKEEQAKQRLEKERARGASFITGNAEDVSKKYPGISPNTEFTIPGRNIGEDQLGGLHKKYRKTKKNNKKHSKHSKHSKIKKRRRTARKYKKGGKHTKKHKK